MSRRTATVHIQQVNTGRRLTASVPSENGYPAVDGDFSIGVTGTGYRIDLDFGDFAGSALGGELLPTPGGRSADDRGCWRD